MTQAQLRKVRPRGSWDVASKTWYFPFSAFEILQKQLGKRFAIHEELSQWVTWFRDPLPSLPSYKEIIASSDFDQVDDIRKPLPHQKVGACWLLQRRGAILADEMGLGKTLTALLAARAMVGARFMKVIVVAPVSLHSHWYREASSLRLQIDLQSWSRLPKELPSCGALLIVDEAHFAQSLKAKRTQSLLRLARHPRLRAIWMISGTPMKNGRPKELYPLLAAIGHPLGIDKGRFEADFCRCHFTDLNKKLSLRSSETNTLYKLHRLIKPVMLHRSKQELLDLPLNSRKEHLVHLTDLEQRGFDHRLSLVLEDYRERVQQGLVSSQAESLVTLNYLRQISTEFKLQAASKLLNHFINKQQGIVVFSSFINPLCLIKKYVGGDLLTGLQSPKERDKAVLRFQQRQSDLLLATYGSGGLGFTLHRARHVFLLDRPWTPGDVAQAEGRCHRIGMQDSMTSHWFKLGFVDQLVDGILTSKSGNIEVLFGSRKILLKCGNLSLMLDKCVEAFEDTISKS